MLDDSLAFSSQGKLFLSLSIASVMRLNFSMQGEDTLEHTNGKCYLCIL